MTTLTDIQHYLGVTADGKLGPVTLGAIAKARAAFPGGYPVAHSALCSDPGGARREGCGDQRMGQSQFGQVSYHWVIELDGTTVRTLPDVKRGAHVGGHNTGNIGICYVGGMDAKMVRPKDTRTPAQKEALLRLIQEYRAQYPNIAVRGHCDWPSAAKACPCFDVTKWLAID